MLPRPPSRADTNLRVLTALVLAQGLENHASAVHPLLTRSACGRNDLEIAEQPEVVGIVIPVTTAALHVSTEAIVLLVNFARFELDMVFLPGAQGDGITQHGIRFLLPLRHVHVALELTFF